MTAAALADVLRCHGETTVADLGGEEMERCRLVLAEVAEVFAIGDVDSAASALNQLMRQYCAPPRLVRHEGWPWHLHVDDDDDDDDDDAAWSRWIGGSAAFALACLLAGRDTVPWGICAADGCERVFVHDDRGGRRSHCSVTCGTRMRVARHRRRLCPSAEGVACHSAEGVDG